MKTELDFERNASLGFFRNIAILIGFMLLGFALFAMCGCATFDKLGGMEALDKLADKWTAKAQALPPVEGIGGNSPVLNDPEFNESLPPEPVSFSSLHWLKPDSKNIVGGFNGSGAVFDRVTLSNLSCNGKSVFYKFDVDLSAWGLSHGEAGAICAVFFERNGRYEGGKFDWVSSSRTSRELKHVESYSNWPQSGIKLPWRGKVAFVIFSADGKRRSNVVISGAK